MQHNADSFIAFMEQVWEIKSEPANGGVILTAAAEYDEWHDAVSSARRLGAKRTGSTLLHGKWVGVYRFPDQSGVVIANDGSSVRPAARAKRAA